MTNSVDADAPFKPPQVMRRHCAVLCAAVWCVCL